MNNEATQLPDRNFLAPLPGLNIPAIMRNAMRFSTKQKSIDGNEKKNSYTTDWPMCVSRTPGKNLSYSSESLSNWR